MSTIDPPAPVPFTSDDYAARTRRAVADATRAGLDGLLVMPGPELVWLTGYRPTAITERLTVLVLAPDREPTLVVPTLERPDAESAIGAPSLTIVDWADGEDPFARAGALVRAEGTMGISDSAWAMHLLGLQDAVPGSSYRSLTQSLPMLRAVKDAAELARLEAAGAAADATYEQILGPVRRPEGDRCRCRPGAAAAGVRPRAGRLHRGRLRPERRQPAPRGGRPHYRGRRRDRPRLRWADVRLRLRHEPHGVRRRAVHRGPRGARDRPAGAASGRRGGPAGHRLPGDRPGGPRGDHGRGVRRAVHPPHRSRHRHHDPRAAVHDRGRGTAAGAGDVLLRRAGHLPRRTVRVRIEDIVTVTETGGQRFNTTARDLQVVE